MTKKILLVVFILLIGAISIIAFNFYKNIKQPVNTSSIAAVPQNAALILQENNFSSLYNRIVSTNIIWEELVGNTETAQKANTQLHYFDSLLNHSFKDLTQQPILTSVHLSGANNYNFIYYINLPIDYSEEKLIQKIKTSTKSNLSKRVYDDVNIYSTKSTPNQKITFTLYKNILSFSYSSILIEDVIRQLNAKTSLKDNPNFSKILKTSGQAEDGNIYINNANFSKLLDQFISLKAKKYNSNFTNYANWTELDIKIKPNSLMLNGFTYADNEVNNNFLSLFKQQKPQAANAQKIVPSNVALFYHYGFSNSKAFFDQRRLLLKSKNQLFNYQKFIDHQSEAYGIDIEEELLNNVGNELAVIITEPLSDDFTHNQFILFQTNDLDKTKADLENMAQKLNAEPYHVSAYKDFPIFKIDLKDVFTHLFEKPFININSPYYTFIDDYVIFGQSENAIKTFVSDYTNKKTLSKDDNFQDFSDHLSSDANLSVYVNIARSVNLFKAYAKKDFIPLFDEKLELFRKFEAVAFQVNTEKNNLYYNNIYLKYNPVYKKDTRSLWELELDTLIERAPELVKNHKTGTQEIFAQDAAHKIYLISNTGKVIWTKQLQNSIIGDVKQLDVYKNNKLQLLFNTKNKIYLLDRNGKNVEKYPIKLKSEASNSISPLDYNKNRNYRIVIGCKDNMVYNYNVQGSLVDGWKYEAIESYANQKIWHFDLAGKDYIVVVLKNGHTKIVERSGKDRLTITKKLPLGENETYLKVGRSLSKTYLAKVDTNGVLTKIFLNNKTASIVFKKIAPKTTFNLLRNQFVFTKDNSISVFDNEQNLIYDTEMETMINTTPHLLINGKIGFATTDNQIYILNKEGNIDTGFPLQGSTAFSVADINNDKTNNLVVGDGNKIVTYNLEE